jgi:Cu+-exporting ATPase
MVKSADCASEEIGHVYVHFIGGFPVDEALRFTASLEQGNEHPLADAIVGEARRRGLILSLATDFESATGCAMRPDVNGTGRMR